MQVIRFGIPSLDQLLGQGPEAPCAGFAVPDRAESATFCLIGPDGTGKSVLALHLASWYIASLDGPRLDHCKVLFASTDLSQARALTAWRNFSLDAPSDRAARLHRLTCPLAEIDGPSGLFAGEVKLQPYRPLESSGAPGSPWFVDYFASPADSPEKERQVAFVDLEATTAGDDWGLLCRLVAGLDTPPDGDERHLVIVDAVEGLEALVGEKDVYGEERTRRSRIAQLVRAAEGKCHLVFVVEAGSGDDRHPEEFIADVVLRLRLVTEGGYLKRTAEVEKVRGQPHVRGQHVVRIRHCGTETDGHPNPDTPDVCRGDGSPISHVQVLHSLHRRSGEGARAEPRQGTPSPAAAAFTGFGITYLDGMLAGGRPPLAEGSDPAGLPGGAITTLLGNDATHKGKLGRAWLSRCFTTSGSTWGVAAKVCMGSIHRGELVRRLNEHGANIGVDEPRLVYRRLDTHHTTPESLFHLFQCVVLEAQRILHTLITGAPPESVAAFRSWKRGQGEGHLWRVRLLIDDWSLIESAYPEVRGCPLLLPSLIDFLKKEGVSTLVIATCSGSPNRILEEDTLASLRTLSDHHLYTWHVPFFGERRIAITALPSIVPGRPATVRELRAGRGTGEILTVDPHFELYEGLESGQATPIPLRVQLYNELRGEPWHASGAPARTWREGVGPLFAKLFKGHANEQVVNFAAEEEYERLRELAYLQSEARLDHTLVLQVDEFWAETQTELLEQGEYLLEEEIPTPQQGQYSPADPLGLFRPTEGFSPHPPGRRIGYFTTVGNDYGRYQGVHTIDRVPYMWDFGLLLCRQRQWEVAAENHPNAAARGRIASAWARLPRVGDARPGADVGVSWPEFFWACRDVQSFPGNDSVPFDVDLSAAESLSCVVLEIWGSMRARMNPTALLFATRREDRRGQSLPQLLQDQTNQKSLFWALLLLRSVMATDRIPRRGDRGPAVPRPASANAAASRHWYASAVSYAALHHPERHLPVGLPGGYCVRGDWFLGVAKGSRSLRLGQRAIDVLCSRRANSDRLQEGFGLPVRDFPHTGDGGLEYRTALPRGDGRSAVTFQELRSLGAHDGCDGLGRPGLNWLWRSLILNYDLHSRIWQKWLLDAFREVARRNPSIEELQEPPGVVWEADRQRFATLCAELVGVLARATYAMPHKDPGGLLT